MTAVQLLNEGVLLLMQLSGKYLKQVVDGLLKAIASIPIGQTKRSPQPRAIKTSTKILSIIDNASKTSLSKNHIQLINKDNFLK